MSGWALEILMRGNNSDSQMGVSCDDTAIIC